MLGERRKTVRDALEEDILSGALKPGDRLPTEPELSQRFAAGRHSVRRAVEALSIDGKPSVEQGLDPSGAFLGSASKAFKGYRIDDYLRGRTTIYARRARNKEARLLRQHPDQPDVVVRATDVDVDGAPIGHSRVSWSASRIRFTLAQPGEYFYA